MQSVWKQYVSLEQNIQYEQYWMFNEMKKKEKRACPVYKKTDCEFVAFVHDKYAKLFNIPMVLLVLYPSNPTDTPRMETVIWASLV